MSHILLGGICVRMVDDLIVVHRWVHDVQVLLLAIEVPALQNVQDNDIRDNSSLEGEGREGEEEGEMGRGGWHDSRP